MRVRFVAICTICSNLRWIEISYRADNELRSSPRADFCFQTITLWDVGWFVLHESNNSWIYAASSIDGNNYAYQNYYCWFLLVIYLLLAFLLPCLYGNSKKMGWWDDWCFLKFSNGIFVFRIDTMEAGVEFIFTFCHQIVSLLCWFNFWDYRLLANIVCGRVICAS